MNHHRRRLIACASLLPLGAFPLASARAADPVANVNFSVLNPPQPVESGGKIEVTEFFWYRCPHCYSLQPYMEKWLAGAPKDVALRRMPAIFNDPRWVFDATAYFAFESLGVLEKVHRPFFDAIHRSRLIPDNAASMAQWLSGQGIDPKQFEATRTSFGVQSRTRHARALTATYRIEGTPTLAVQGRYTVSTEQGGTQMGSPDVPDYQSGMLKIVDYLVGRVRRSGGK